MNCPHCGGLVPTTANYCPTCGARQPVEALANKPEPAQLKPRLDVFFLSMVLTLALSFILMTVFHLPIFVFGAFLPFFWMGARRRS